MVKLKTFIAFATVACISLSCIKFKDADLVLHNGTIYTCDVEFSAGQAMAVKDGKILEIGPEHQILNKYSSTEKLDLKKKTVVPAFFDAHSYLLAKTLKSNALDYTSLSNVQFDNSNINYLYNVPPEKLEQINYPGYQFVIRSTSGNTISIDRKTYQAVFQKSSDKKRIIHSKDSIAVVIQYLEKNQLASYSTNRMSDELFKNGYSGCTSFGVSSSTADKIITENNPAFYHQIVLAGNTRNFQWLTKTGRVDSGTIHLKGLSYFIDGSIGSKEALLKQPYLSEETNGKLFADSFALYELPELCASLKFQLVFHAYGDAAFELAANQMGEALVSVNDNRWRIEHNQLVDTSDYEKLRSYSILPSIQPTQANRDKKEFNPSLGVKRNCSSYNFGELFAQNQFIASGSLYPIGGMNPFKQFKALLKTEKCYYPLGRKSALKSLTIWPAMLAFFDGKTGSLEIGKNADFLVLSIDPMKAPIEKLGEIKVLQTFIRGELKYSETK